MRAPGVHHQVVVRAVFVFEGGDISVFPSTPGRTA
jgi:hypothetical protein